VSGGIAAYKAAEIVRGLVDAGANVRVVMTPAATKFIGPLTLAVLSKNPVVADLWDSGSGAVDHIELARQTDVLAVAPATADSLAKLARGIADDVLSTYALSHRGSLVVAPAMNTWMWTHPAARKRRASRGAGVVVPPDSGDPACGDVGPDARPSSRHRRDDSGGRPHEKPRRQARRRERRPHPRALDPSASSPTAARTDGLALAREARSRSRRRARERPVALEPPPASGWCGSSGRSR
jgi:3-polyprenyl-4-hydroxybenzoate decarboxylase